MSKSRTNARISSKFNGVTVASSGAIAGQSLVYNGAAWSPGVPAGLGSVPASLSAPAVNSYIKFTGSIWTYVALAPVRITAYSGIPSTVVSVTITLTGSNFTSNLSAIVNTTAYAFNYIDSGTGTVTIPPMTDSTIFLYLIQPNGQFAFVKLR
jgi:hypothetical protein